jgi:HAMP domain-containing protein
VKKFGDGLLKFNERILEVVKNWQALVQADDAEQFATFKKRIEQFVDFRKELVRRGVEINAAAGREWGDNDANRAVRTALNKDLEALSKVYAERSKKLAQQTDKNHMMAFVLTCLGALALIVVVLGVLIIARSIARPLSVITATIKQVADGIEGVEVPHTGRSDEIGALARAIKIFQEAMDRNRNLNSQVLEESRARDERTATSRPRSTPSGKQSAACCARSPTMRPRCATPRRLSRAFHLTPAVARWPPPARPSRPPATSLPSPAPLRNCPLPSRKSGARCASRPTPSSRRASAPRSRLPKSKDSRPRRNASTACSA